MKCTLGDWIDKKGWTDAYYAKITKRSPRMISYFKHNQRPMMPEDIHYAEKYLGVSFSQLYVWEEIKT